MTVAGVCVGCFVECRGICVVSQRGGSRNRLVANRRGSHNLATASRRRATEKIRVLANSDLNRDPAHRHGSATGHGDHPSCGCRLVEVGCRVDHGEG